jgi:predicted metal-binding protein
MPRTEPFPYSHFVDRTRKEHKCELCGYPIVRGAKARYKNLLTGKRGYIHNIPGCPDLVGAYLIEPVIDHSVRNLCPAPYHGHKHGCPNCYKNQTCPPHAPLFEDVIDIDEPIYVIFNVFDLDLHVKKMKAKHENWSDRQLKNCRHWQGTARKKLREKIKDFKNAYCDEWIRDNPDEGYSAMLTALNKLEVLSAPETCSPEATGINVTATMAKLWINLEWPPKRVTFQVALIGTKKEV